MTDTDRAFRCWWEQECPTDYDEYEWPEKKAAVYAWHAAVSWATARERQRAAQKAEECGKYSLQPGALAVSGRIAAAIRGANGGGNG